MTGAECVRWIKRIRWPIFPLSLEIINTKYSNSRKKEGNPIKYKTDGKYSQWLSQKFTSGLLPAKFSPASKWSLTVRSCLLWCTFHQINYVPKLNCYAFFIVLNTASAQRLPQSPTFLCSSSEAWDTSDSYFDNVVWKEDKKWVGGPSDDVVSGASALFPFLPWSLFLPLMAQCPSKRWYPRQPPIVCLLFLSFPFFSSKMISLKRSLSYFICKSKIKDMRECECMCMYLNRK